MVNEAGGTIVEGTPRLSAGFTIAVPVNNAGLIEVEGSSLNFDGGLTNSGSILGGSGTVISLGGTLTTTAASSIQGYDVSLGSGNLSGLYSGAMAPRYSAPSPFPTAAVGITGTQLAIEGGNLDLTGATLLSPLTFDDVSLSGTLLSNSDIHITGLLHSSGADTLAGTGTIYLDGGTAANPNTEDGTLTLNCSLVNNGFTYMGASSTSLGTEASLTNAAGATLVDLLAMPLAGASSEEFSNNGTFYSQGFDYYVDVPFTNGPTGIVHLQANTLSFSDVENSSGALGGRPGHAALHRRYGQFRRGDAGRPKLLDHGRCRR